LCYPKFLLRDRLSRLETSSNACKFAQITSANHGHMWFNFCNCYYKRSDIFKAAPYQNYQLPTQAFSEGKDSHVPCGRKDPNALIKCRRLVAITRTSAPRSNKAAFHKTERHPFTNPCSCTNVS
jgi:hypothetical protein